MTEHETQHEDALKSDLFETQEACRQAGFETQWQTNTSNERELLFAIPNGYYTRWNVINQHRVLNILSYGLQPVTALGEYEALLYRDTSTIEAEIAPFETLGPNGDSTLERLSMEWPEALSGDSFRWGFSFIADADQQWSASIGKGSNCFPIYTARPWRSMKTMTLTIAGVPVSNHDEALRVLEEFANSVLFELDLIYGFAATLTRLTPLARKRRTTSNQRPPSHLLADDETGVETLGRPHLPRNSYPEKPLALYWYARGATNMPLLQYLACYQILEYHFPLYYQRETLGRIKQELLDPQFSPQNDLHLSRILRIVSAEGRNFGEEREQLGATIRACVSLDRLKEYLMEPSRKNFFSGKQPIKHVPLLNPESTNSDLRDRVSDRIYDIRCRIVHTKSDSGGRYSEMILPFSKEAESLSFDIELIQFLAQRVLIHRAKPLRL